jgi:ATP-dependent Clp protease protease subunit
MIKCKYIENCDSLYGFSHYTKYHGFTNNVVNISETIKSELNHVWPVNYLEKNTKYQKISSRTKFGTLISKSPAPDLPSLVLDLRIVYFGAPLTNRVTELVISELLWLNFTNLDKPIHMYINSTGSQNAIGETVGIDGEAYAILDTLKYIRPTHYTVCIGQAFGNAALILASGKTGSRDALPNVRIKTCPPRINQSFGRVVDQITRADQLEILRNTYCAMLADFTGKTQEEILKVIGRDRYWTLDTAVGFGIIDRVITVKEQSWNKPRNYLESSKTRFEDPTLDLSVY